MKKVAWFFPVSAGIMWGSVGIFIRSLSGYGMDTATIVGSRTMISVILMLIGIAVIDKSQLKIRLKDLWIFVLASWLGMLGVNLTYNEAVNYVHLSLAAVLLSLSPVYVLILARVFFKEKITIRKAGCAALAVFGCSLASGLLENLGGMKISGYGNSSRSGKRCFLCHVQPVYQNCHEKRLFRTDDHVLLYGCDCSDVDSVYRLEDPWSVFYRSSCAWCYIYDTSCNLWCSPSVYILYDWFSVYGCGKSLYSCSR